MRTLRGGNRYPRPGERLAPATLGEVLLEPAPSHLVGPMGQEGLRLCDLDESVWERLRPVVIFELAAIIVDRVSAGCARKVFDNRHFPRPSEDLSLEALQLEHRTYLCLAREGFDKDPAALAKLTLGEILAIRAFGPRCLVDLLSALETALARQQRDCPELADEARRLASADNAAEVRSDDPRFGPLIRGVDVQARSVDDLARRLLSRAQPGPDPEFAAAELRRLRQRLEQSPHKTLEQELIDIFAPTNNPRNAEILIGYYGWGDGRHHTLAEIGARHGMTRERTRQICAKLVKHSSPKTIYAPVIDRVLAMLAQRVPCAAEVLEQELVDAGLTAVGMRLEGIAAAAELLGRSATFRVVRVDGSRLAVPPRQSGTPGVVVEIAKKEVYYHGLTTVRRVEQLAAGKSSQQLDVALVTQIVEQIDGFQWLDCHGGWFRFTSINKHGLPRAIEKILAVAGPIRVGALRSAIGRNRRVWKTPPPKNVLLEFCRRAPGLGVDGDRVFADPPRDWTDILTGVERELVEILTEHGPVMERGSLEDLCVGRGINRFSFHAFIASSGVIAQYGHSVYGLLGAKASNRAVQSLIRHARAGRASARVLNGHGITDDGNPWLSYRLSKAASTYAVVTVPSDLKHLVHGKFQLLTRDGQPVGTLAAKDGRAWGLGAFLRRHDAQVDDRVDIVLDVDQRVAVITINEASVENRMQETGSSAG